MRLDLVRQADLTVYRKRRERLLRFRYDLELAEVLGFYACFAFSPLLFHAVTCWLPLSLAVVSAIGWIGKRCLRRAFFDFDLD